MIHVSFFKHSKKAVLALCLFCILTLSCISVQKVYGATETVTPAAGGATDQSKQIGKNIQIERSFKDFGCGISIDGLVNCVAYMTYQAEMLSATFLTISEYLLNYAIAEFVVGMGTLVGNMTGVVVAWSTLRDIANVFLVFTTIYIGISMIIGSSGMGSKQTLFKVILAAIVVNFSMTVAKIVIDVSNLATSEIYAMMLDGGKNMPGASADDPRPDLAKKCTTPLTGAQLQSGQDPCIRKGISLIFDEKLYLSSVFNPYTIQADKGESMGWRMLMSCVFGTILMLTATFVFGSAAFLLIGRFLTLMFLIIVSPVALVAMVTGIFSGQGSKWWKMLLNQSFFAPAMMLMWWIGLQLMQGLQGRFALSGNIYSGALDINNDTAFSVASGMILYMIVAMGVLIYSLILAKKMGASGADAVMKTGNKWARGKGAPWNVGRFAVNNQATRLLKDQTYGRGARGIANAIDRGFQRGQEMEFDPVTGEKRYKRGVGRSIARLAVWTGADKPLAGAIRSQAKGIQMRDDRLDASKKELQEKLTKTNDRELVGRLMRGDASMTDEQKAKAAKVLGAMKPEDMRELQRMAKSAEANAGGSTLGGTRASANTQSVENQWARVAEHLNQDSLKGIEGSTEFMGVVKSVHDARIKAVGDQISAFAGGIPSAEQLTKMQKTFDLLSVDERKKALASNANIAQYISTKQVEEIEKDVTMDAVRKTVHEQRSTELGARLTANNTKGAQTLLAGMTETERKAHYGGVVKDMARHTALQATQATHTAEEAQEFAELQVKKTNIPKLVSVMGNTDVVELHKTLGNDFSTNTDIVLNLTGQHLRALDKAGNLSIQQQTEIKNAVMGATILPTASNYNAVLSAQKFFTTDPSGMRWG